MAGTDLTYIVEEIVTQCRLNGNPVSEPLAAFVANTIFDPNTNMFFLEHDVDESSARDVIEFAVERLQRKNDAAIDTCKLQVGFDTAYVQQEQNRQEEIAILAKSATSLIGIILNSETNNRNDFDSLTNLYRSIFAFLMLKAGQGANVEGDKSNDRTVEKEVAAALESVFPRVGLRSFVSLTAHEKTGQLNELENIVLGIRLFNKQIGKGGVGLVDVPTLALEEGSAVLLKVQQDVFEMTEECQLYTDLFNHINKLGDATPTKEDQQRLREELAHRRQYLSYCLNLQDEIQTSLEKIDDLRGRYETSMEELQVLVGSRTSVPKDQVYPKFDILAQLFSAMSDERRVLQMRQQLFDVLSSFKNPFMSVFKSELRNALHHARTIPDEDEETDASSPLPDTEDRPLRLMPETTADFMQIPLDFQGFCLWTIVESDGLLMPGNPSLGVLKYENKFCVFSTERAIHEFESDPSKYLTDVKRICRRRPELIHLLQLQDDFPAASLSNLLQGREGIHPPFAFSAPVLVDAATETPLHFVERNVNPQYHWNEWELRKKALQMANIRKKRTTGAQCDLSHFRRENETQVWLAKDQTTNTGVTQGTNPIRSRNYIKGLRGDPSAEKVVTNLRYEL
eukprot:GILJ01006420.1.p1 GENE.GILJ01006420.1~~GILJ01006420.1.p1  ORF type:complete len:635 (+),score=116.45 GILJ01006420.1:31-1905(+)